MDFFVNYSLKVIILFQCTALILLSSDSVEIRTCIHHDNVSLCHGNESIVSFPDPTMHARKGSGDIAGLFLLGLVYHHVTTRAPIQTYANNYMIAELAESSANVPRPFPPLDVGLGTRLTHQRLLHAAMVGYSEVSHDNHMQATWYESDGGTEFRNTTSASPRK